MSEERLHGLIHQSIATGLNVFDSAKKDKEEILKLHDRVKDLEERTRKAKEELADVRQQKKEELRDIEHLVKCKEERLQLERERMKVQLEGEYQKKQMDMLVNNQKETLALMEKGEKKLQDIYGKILDRLPNVNMHIKQSTGG